MGFQTLVEQFFQEEGIQYNVLIRDTILGFGMSGQHGRFQCYVKFEEEDRFLLVHSQCGFNAPPEKRSEMAELMARINFGIKVGNFEMNFEDGEMRFKTSLRISPDAASITVIRDLILTNILTMDKALPVLMELIHGTASPQDLYEKFRLPNP